ncbi:MAG: hypothetical protein MRY83_03675 [Flavobacteriales bacterium]|nr:hypothetical protein [Flavobacteriales bacterium]
MKSFKLLIIFILASHIFSCKKQEGCTSPLGVNYDPEAELDDGSCIWKGYLAVKSENAYYLEEAEVKVRAIDGSYSDFTTISGYNSAEFRDLVPKTYQIEVEATYWENVYVNGSFIKEYYYTSEDFEYTIQSNDYKVIEFD